MKITDLHQTLDDKLDYTVSFASWLGLVSDTISSVAWTVPAGLTGSDTSNTTTTATIYLTASSSGRAGVTYVVKCKITTAASPARIKAASFSVRLEGEE